MALNETTWDDEGTLWDTEVGLPLGRTTWDLIVAEVYERLLVTRDRTLRAVGTRLQTAQDPHMRVKR